MRVLLSIVLTFITYSSFAQIGTGQWRMHVPASQAVGVAYGNNTVMAALSAGVVEYDISGGETKIYNDLNGLSGTVATCIGYEQTTKSFFVGYEDGNVDQILNNGAVISIPGIDLAQINGDKRINGITSEAGLVYISTGFSVVVVNPQKHEVKDTYYPTGGQVAINMVAITADSIYALTDTKLYRGFRQNAFLADQSQWSLDSRVSNPVNGAFKDIVLFNNDLHVLYQNANFGQDSIYQLTNSGLSMVIGNGEIRNITQSDNKLQVVLNYGVLSYDPSYTIVAAYGSYGTTNMDPSDATFDGTNYWIADNASGLVQYGSVSNQYRFITQEGPPRNTYFSMNSFEDKIAIAAGRVNRVTFTFQEAATYTFQDESWKLISKGNQPLWTSRNVWDMGAVAVNPLNKDEVAIGGYCMDPLAIANGSTLTKVFDTLNSPLKQTTLGNSYVCISAMEYDESGNLWLSNGYSNQPLKVLKADGSWKVFETGIETKGVFTGNIVIDFNGNKWMAIYNKGLLGYKDNGTIDNTSDDTYKLLRSGEGIGNLPSENITALAADFDNEIWIGTDNGLAILYNSEGLFSASGVIDASQILVNFEGNVEILLGNTSIKDIEIDGGNRKWIATETNGIFLLSADGQEVISHFTKDNCPLISNNIVDIEFNHKTGELFIITDIGLVSYRSDATYEDPDYASTTVFPNPVNPDYFGPITIQGIRYDSDVKITDAAGNLVYKTTSNGGTATWNGKRLDGTEVASGVYIIWTASNTLKFKKVGKVVVIR